MSHRSSGFIGSIGLVLLALFSTALAEEPAASKSIVVFGATGSIGQSIVAEALSRGHAVKGVSRSPETFNYNEDNFTGVQGNPTDAASEVHRYSRPSFSVREL